MPKVDMNKVSGKSHGKFLRLRDEFTFGQYEGQIIQDVAMKDPQYVRWCMANIGWFKFRPEDQQALEDLVGADEVKEFKQGQRQDRQFNRRQDTYERFQERDRGRFGDNEMSGPRWSHDRKSPWED